MAEIDLDEFQFGETLRGDREGDRVFDRFTLRRCIGRGGMGVVWLAYDERLSRDVVLKFIPELLRFDEAAIAELKAETKICLELSHPNIVRVYDFFSDATRAGICMEYVEGETLSKLRVARPNKVFEPAHLSRWVVQMIDALTYAHETARLVHRDLKPENLLINRAGDLRIMDFGIARSLTDSLVRVTMQSTSLGTLAYMSPQQAAGHPPQPSDDLYALGSTLYEMLTGKPPFYSGDIPTQLRAEMPPSVAERRAQFGIVGEPIPQEWETAIGACLAKDPGKRPQSARELGVMLGLVTPADSLRLDASLHTTPPQHAGAAFSPREQVVIAPVAEPSSPRAITRKITAHHEKKRSLAPTLALVTLALALGAGGAYYFLNQNKSTVSTSATSPPKPSEAQTAPKPSAVQSSSTQESASNAKTAQPAVKTVTSGSSATTSSSEQVAQPSGPLRVPSQYKNIQAAIDAALPGQTIEVASGTYREALKFKSGLTLVGKGDTLPVVISNGLGGSVLFVNECREGEIRHMIFEHDEGPSNQGNSPVIMIRNSSLKIEGCKIRRGVAEGVVITGDGIVEFVKTDSEFNGLDGFKAEARARPIFKGCASVRNGGSGFVALGIQTTLTLENCQARLNGEDGISVEQSGVANVQSSSFEGNTRCGAYLKDRGTQSNFVESTLTKNERDNIHVLDGATLRVGRSKIIDGRRHGIVIVDAGEGAVIEGNTISKNAGHGIQIAADQADGTAMSGIVLRDNTIASNMANGILLMGTGLRPRVEGNKISNSGLLAIAVEDGAEPLLVNNNIQGKSTTFVTKNQTEAKPIQQTNQPSVSQTSQQSMGSAAKAQNPSFPVPPPVPSRNSLPAPQPATPTPPAAPPPPATPPLVESPASEPQPQKSRQPVMPAKNRDIPVLNPEAP